MPGPLRGNGALGAGIGSVAETDGLARARGARLRYCGGLAAAGVHLGDRIAVTGPEVCRRPRVASWTTRRVTVEKSIGMSTVFTRCSLRLRGPFACAGLARWHANLAVQTHGAPAEANPLAGLRPAPNCSPGRNQIRSVGNHAQRTLRASARELLDACWRASSLAGWFGIRAGESGEASDFGAAETGGDDIAATTLAARNAQ